MFDVDETTLRLTDLLLGYVRDRVTTDPVELDTGATRTELEALAPSMIREEGNDPADVLSQFATVLAPRVISCDSPRFLSFIPAAPTKAAMLFDAVVSASSLNGTSWLEAAGAIHAENQTLRFMSDLAGLPPTAGGCFVSGGSAANLSALAVARDVHRSLHGVEGRDRLAILVSDQAHSSISSTARLLDVDAHPVASIRGRLTGEGVHEGIRAAGEGRVCAVVATAGTTNVGVVDDLAGIAEVAGGRGIWFHVDAAYGAAALLAPSASARFEGIERADSLVMDPHKWFFAPFDCAALLYRNPHLARAVHTQDASYLESIHEDAAAWNPADYAYHLTRRARGLALWFSLCVHGVAAYREAVEASLGLARHVADRIRAEPTLELVMEPELSVVVFRRVGWTFGDCERWSRDLLATGTGFVLPSRWEGEPVLRFAFLHPRTTTEIVEEILATLR